MLFFYDKIKHSTDNKVVSLSFEETFNYLFSFKFSSLQINGLARNNFI